MGLLTAPDERRVRSEKQLLMTEDLFSSRPLEMLDWGCLPYGEALSRQERLVDERIADLAPDRLVLVEHPPVVTLGRSGGWEDLRAPREVLLEKGMDLYQIDRGGRATFHGPGQLVAYPILKLEDHDLHRYVQRLQDSVSDVLRTFGLNPQAKRGMPGVWVGSAKVASIGVAVRKWVTYHGVALNVTTDPEWFHWIVPCGQTDERMTSMERSLAQTVDMAQVKAQFVAAFKHRFEYGGHPAWLNRKAPSMPAIAVMEARLQEWRLATVCQSAHCPNLGECFDRGTATFMILGTLCTRNCRFCAVEKAVPQAVDPDEPVRVARAAASLGLKHVVVTSVTRDDLPDGGAAHFSETIDRIRTDCPGVAVEVLVPDFQGSLAALITVCQARPDMLNHNVETVADLYPRVRPQGHYGRSLSLLEIASRTGLPTKSGLMLGLGENEGQIQQTLRDLRRAGCLYLTLGQYLSPSKDHLPVSRYVTPQEFEKWATIGRSMGFACVASGPLVRSSYRAAEMIEACGLEAGPGINRAGQVHGRRG
jgi:lipoic acid synthetase